MTTKKKSAPKRAAVPPPTEPETTFVEDIGLAAAGSNVSMTPANLLEEIDADLAVCVGALNSEDITLYDADVSSVLVRVQKQLRAIGKELRRASAGQRAAEAAQ